MESLYQALLERSFNEHLTWYVADGISYIAVDIREIPLKGQLDQLGNRLRKVQKKIGIPVSNGQECRHVSTKAS